MNRKNNNNDEAICLLCDLWWLWLLIFLALVVALVFRDYWVPYISPEPSFTPTVTPSVEIIPTVTTIFQPTITPLALPTMGTGDVQATLRWNSLNDLDLHVIDPEGHEIFFRNKSSPTGGLLDVDNNAGCGDNGTERPVENIFWPANGAPHGQYQVSVVFYQKCDSNTDSSAFSVTLLVDGVTKTFSGEVSETNKTFEVYSFTR